jgi:hypothetical protein
MQSGTTARTYWIDGRGLPGMQGREGAVVWDGGPVGDGQEGGAQEGTTGTQEGGWWLSPVVAPVLLCVRVIVK